MDSVVIKPASTEDESFVMEMMALTMQTWPHFAWYSKEYLIGLVQIEMSLTKNRQTHTLIALLEGTRAGAVWLQQEGESADHGFTVGIAVEPHFQGQGIGTRLLEEALNFCRNDGCRTLNLKVNPNNEGALRLYRRLGFLEVSLEMKMTL